MGLVAFSPLHAQTCRGLFASLTPDQESAAAVVTQTYRDLIDTVRDPLAKAQWISAIEEAKDPFAVAEDVDLLVTRRHLEQFRQMLEKLGYTQASLRSLLLPVVAQRQADRRQAEQAQASVVHQNRGNFTLPLPEGKRRTVSPDGRYVAGVDGDKFYVADGVTGERFAGPAAPVGSSLHFSPDGDTAYVGDDKSVAIYHHNGHRFTLDREVPIAQGWWATRVTGLTKHFCGGNPIPIANPRYLLAELRHMEDVPVNEQGVWLFDVTSGKVKRLNGTQDVVGLDGQGSYGKTWTVAPGTNRIFIRVPTRNDRKMKILWGDIDEKGFVAQWKDLGVNTERDLSQVVMWASRDYLAVRFVPKQKTMSVYPLAGGSPMSFGDRVGGAFPTQFVFHPDGKTGLANFEGYFQQVDLESRQVTGRLTIPKNTWFSPDGERLLTLTKDSALKSTDYQSQVRPFTP